jgi:hypothetical protein
LRKRLFTIPGLSGFMNRLPGREAVPFGSSPAVLPGETRHPVKPVSSSDPVPSQKASITPAPDVAIAEKTWRLVRQPCLSEDYHIGRLSTDAATNIKLAPRRKNLSSMPHISRQFIRRGMDEPRYSRNGEPQFVAKPKSEGTYIPS